MCPTPEQLAKIVTSIAKRSRRQFPTKKTANPSSNYKNDQLRRIVVNEDGLFSYNLRRITTTTHSLKAGVALAPHFKKYSELSGIPVKFITSGAQYQDDTGNQSVGLVALHENGIPLSVKIGNRNFPLIKGVETIFGQYLSHMPLLKKHCQIIFACQSQTTLGATMLNRLDSFAETYLRDQFQEKLTIFGDSLANCPIDEATQYLIGTKAIDSVVSPNNLHLSCQQRLDTKGIIWKTENLNDYSTFYQGDEKTLLQMSNNHFLDMPDNLVQRSSFEVYPTAEQLIAELKRASDSGWAREVEQSQKKKNAE